MGSQVNTPKSCLARTTDSSFILSNSLPCGTSKFSMRGEAGRLLEFLLEGFEPNLEEDLVTNFRIDRTKELPSPDLVGNKYRYFYIYIYIYTEEGRMRIVVS